MAYARIRYRHAAVSSSSLSGKAHIDYAAGATSEKGNVDSIHLALGENLYTVVLQPGKVFPVQLRNNFLQLYFNWKEIAFEIGGGQTVPGVAISHGRSIYMGDRRLANIGRQVVPYSIVPAGTPDFVFLDTMNAIDGYGIGITVGADFLPGGAFGYSLNQSSLYVKQAIVDMLDWCKTHAGYFIPIP